MCTSPFRASPWTPTVPGTRSASPARRAIATEASTSGSVSVRGARGGGSKCAAPRTCTSPVHRRDHDTPEASCASARRAREWRRARATLVESALRLFRRRHEQKRNEIATVMTVMSRTRDRARMAVLEEIEDEPPARVEAPAAAAPAGASDSDSDDEPPPLESAAAAGALNLRRRVAERVNAARADSSAPSGSASTGAARARRRRLRARVPPRSRLRARRGSPRRPRG